MAGWIERAYWNVFTLWHARNERALPYWRLEDILELQSRRVRAIVAHAYATVPYYRAAMDARGLTPRDFRTADDLARLPLVTGEDLVRAPEDFRSRRYAHQDTLVVHSTGTIRPKQIAYDHAALFFCLASGQRQRDVLAKLLGRQWGYREMEVEREGGMSAQIRQFYESHSWVPRPLDYQREYLSVALSFDESIARINRFQPDVLRGYGNFIGCIFRHAHRHHIPIHLPRVVVYSSNPMAESHRKIIEEEYGVPVLSNYQASEALRLGFQCEQRAGFHINLDQVAIRVVDAEGNPVPPGGQGHLIISNLINRATVLLNYRLGDVVTLSASACPCGRTLPTIERIDGRANDLVILPDGRTVYRVDLLLYQVPGIEQIQVIQNDYDQFVFHVVRMPSADWQNLCVELTRLARSILGANIHLDIIEVDQIPREPSGKVRSVISRVQV